jgi:hypothetical protein
MRRLLLHAGAGKTGTSALQLFLDANRDWLLRQGIVYPEGPNRPDPGTKISSGNGGWLFGFLRSGEYWRELVDQLTDTGGPCDVMISSELVAHAPKERIAELADRLTAIGFELQPFYLVRNVDAWYLSAYQQNVKRHGYTRSFAHFCATYPLEFTGALDRYESVLGEGAMRLYSYEAGKGDIVRYVLQQVLGVTAEPPPHDNPSINRSLTGDELAVLRLANQMQHDAGVPKETIDRRSTMISDELIRYRPTVPAHERYYEAMPAEVAQRLRPDIERINARLRTGHIGFRPAATVPQPRQAAASDHYLTALQLLMAAELRDSQSRNSDEIARILTETRRAQQREQALNAEIVALRSSTSWRITAPLRAVSGSLSGSRSGS